VNTVTKRDVMDALLIGYARVSTEEQDLTAQRDALAAIGVSAEKTYVDQNLTGTNRERPGLRQALAACRAGDTLVVTKVDRLARSLPDARAIVEDSSRRGPHPERASRDWRKPSTFGEHRCLAPLSPGLSGRRRRDPRPGHRS